MNKLMETYNPDLCPHGNQIGMCDVCNGERLKNVLQNKNQNIESVPEGWMTNTGLARQLSKSKQSIK